MTSDNPHQESRTALDEAARSAHTASLDRLSPQVQAQLAQRRRAALNPGTRAAGVRAWPMLALGSAAALTLVVGLYVMGDSGTAELPTTADQIAAGQTPDSDTAAVITTPAIEPTTTAHTTPSPAAVAGVVARDGAADSDAIDDDGLPAALLAAEFNTADEALGFGVQEESPDFYLWLGSEDARAAPTESL